MSTCVAFTANAQTVVGNVIDANQSAVGGAIVTAVSANGTATTVLSSASGQFAFRLASAGAYAIRVARVGFASETTTRITVGAADTARVTATAPTTRVAFASASTKNANACRVRPDSAVVTSKVWAEARKALLTTQVPRYGSNVVGQWQEFERGLDSNGTKVTSQRVTQATHSTPKVFQSIPATSMSSRGFVITDASGTWYYAPDVELLLSPEFEAGHCFKLASSDRGTPDAIGVEFAPTRNQRGVFDIRGTIWIERATGALRSVEFFYTGLPDLAPQIAGGGRLTFTRLPTGEFAVTSWMARLPVFDVIKRNMNARDNDTRYARSDTLVRALQEVGGTLQQMRDGAALIYEVGASPAGGQPPQPAPSNPQLTAQLSPNGAEQPHSTRMFAIIPMSSCVRL